MELNIYKAIEWNFALKMDVSYMFYFILGDVSVENNVRKPPTENSITSEYIVLTAPFCQKNMLDGLGLLDCLVPNKNYLYTLESC